MTMTVIETERVADVALPVMQLAVQMRLADGVAASPDQAERLRLRLRAALDAVERDTGRILLARTITLGITRGGQMALLLPFAPVGPQAGVSVERAGVQVDLGPTRVEADAHRPRLELPQGVAIDETVRVTVQAGFGTWDQVPDGLRQAVLLTAEMFDVGGAAELQPVIDALLKPFRSIRLGRADR